MKQKVDPQEVLKCLNEMGFRHISAHQLKEFIIDLKKVIKHDRMKICRETTENFEIEAYSTRNKHGDNTMLQLLKPTIKQVGTHLNKPTASLVHAKCVHGVCYPKKKLKKVGKANEGKQAMEATNNKSNK